MNRSISKIRHIQEANSRLEKRMFLEKTSIQGTLLTEQSVFLKTYPNINLIKSVKDTTMSVNGQFLRLSKRNPQNGKIIPNTTFQYKIKGKYGIIAFAVDMRNFVRMTTGVLELEAKPSNNLVSSIMRKLIPKESVTNDGWLKVRIPVDKINAALEKLFNNKGTEAEIDAGQGIKIILKNSN